MSQGNIQLGIAAICGGATFGLASIANLNSGVGIALAVAVGGIVLIALASKNSAPVEELAQQVKAKAKKEIKKLPSPQKVKQQASKQLQKAQQQVQKVFKTPKKEEKEEDSDEAPETPEKKKSKKKKSKSGAGNVTSPISPAPQQHAKPKGTPKAEDDSKSKNQQRKLKKKEADEKQKIEDEKQKAAELARKAAEQKREAAQQKKIQAKARKAAQKVTETKPETKAETKTHVSHEPEEGWEVAPSRKSRGPKEESKEPIVIDVKVPPRQHAMIIGKQGEGIKKLQEDLDVIITMPKRDSGNDLILIKGLHKDVHLAKKAIEELATKGYSNVSHPGWITKQAPLQTKQQLLTVFGDKGSTLQRISQATGTRLQMPEKGTNNFAVSVTGDEKDVEHALQLIQELSEQGHTKTTHPDWVTEEVQVRDTLGAIIGPKGENVKQISKDFKVKIDTPKREDLSQKQDVVYIRGPKPAVLKAKRRILEIVASNQPPIEQEIPDPAWQEDVQEVAW